MSEIDSSKSFEIARDVVSSFGKYREAFNAVREARRDLGGTQRELAKYFRLVEGQSFIISAYCGTRAFKQVGRNNQVSWTYVATSPLVGGDKPVPFEPCEMIIGRVGDDFEESEGAMSLFFPGNDTVKHIVGFNDIVSIEPVPEQSSISQ